MPTEALIAFLVAALAAAGACGVLAVRRGRRLRATEDAILALARSWSEDGSARARLCAAAQLVAGAQGAFLAEPTRRGDQLSITAVAGFDGLLGVEAPLDPTQSLLARSLVLGEHIHIAQKGDFPDRVRPLLERLNVQSATLRPVFHGERPVGVLAVAWREEQCQLDPQRVTLMNELAAEACRAIERDAHLALLSRQARTDELTALPNRRAWDEAVETEISRAQRTGEPLCLALLDLDHFKAFNDAHGHQAGDTHLRRTAAAWRRELRAIDVLARYGGEEFGVLLPSCDIAEASEVVDRVRAATPGGESASAGVVQYDGLESSESLLARADAALYRAKHSGRATTVPA